ncbi:MAG: dTDP-4-dehydrorhamnose 3,5-epimerase [Candidatus Hydrogenedentota bacterium]
MPVLVTPTEIEDVVLVESRLFRDDRGYFTEVFSARSFADAGLPVDFVQDNLSKSAKGTLRGLHYQIEPNGQGKLVTVLTGAIFDVAVDLRRGSPTFGKWVGRELRGDSGLALWVPVGFAHGFVALEDDTRVFYKCTTPWAPQAERSLRYDDKEVGIEWPIEPRLISEKDAAAPALDAAEFNFSY